MTGNRRQIESGFMGTVTGGEQRAYPAKEQKSVFELGSSALRRAGVVREQGIHSFLERRRTERSKRKPLRVLKFGGTSVGDVGSMEKVVEIVRATSLESNVVVVVSAMSGVTNKLIEAARQAEVGDAKQVAAIFEDLRQKHETTAAALIRSTVERTRVERTISEILQEGDHVCQGTMLLHELTVRALDSIASLGERLSAPLLAAALMDRGVDCETIEATELIVTDSFHGGAEPRMRLTRERCEARLRPLLQRGKIPVVTGYIGAPPEGVLTTLGRGGADYSATILGAALEADEVVIWTDVDGVLTADPRLVPSVCTIPEISYLEAAELAYFGAKVLHPKTLRPLMQSDIPVSIRNTFAPGRPGTKITPSGCSHGGGVKALTAISDVALITVGGPGIVGARDVLGRTFKTTAEVQADVLLVSQSSSQNDICFVVPSAIANRTIKALRREFGQDLAHEEVEHITINRDVSIVAVVGEKMRGTPGIVGRTFEALGRENVSIIAIAQGSSETNISFLVARKDTKAALMATHQEFRLGELHCGTASASCA